MTIHPPNISAARKTAREIIGASLRDLPVGTPAKDAKKKIQKEYPFEARKGYGYYCWRSELAMVFGGKNAPRKPEAIEQSAVALLYFAGQRLEFGRPVIEQLRGYVGRKVR